MPGVGGPFESISLSGRYFSPAADIEAPRTIGGSQNEVQPNGDGTSRLIKSVVTAKIGSVKLTCDDFLGDHEFLQELANRKDFFDVNVTYSSGAVWQGAMQIVDELTYSNSDATATFALEGTGILTQQ